MLGSGWGLLGLLGAPWHPAAVLGGAQRWARLVSGASTGATSATSNTSKRLFQSGASCWAGHNRWSKVKNVKGPRDAARSRLFQRLAMMLRSAAKEGGPDPALNPALARVLEQCRAHNVPKATIEAAILGGVQSPSGSLVLVPARGPGGSVLLLQVQTQNPRRTQKELQDLLTQHGGSLAEGARHGFEEKGVVRVLGRDPRGHPVALEVALEAAADAGAEDVCLEEEEEEPNLKFICQASALRKVRAHLEASGLAPISSTLEFLPLLRVSLPEETREELERLLQALEDHPDVTRLYHNVQ
ncbi:LOW QUALITY PROTEIN: translational activator of cytochrome c oxidase 1 [Heliangelus exortis]|uniref:LOW QUALITY PROTEIN: translational activator of cytochrome c oxidase 1 n=1 Tax=Heliangelus exortis TaxID=472823 RepID=UPI003A905711